MTLRICTVFVLLCTCFVAMPKAHAESIVAEVGDKQISLDEFNRRYNDLKEKVSDPPTRKAFLEDLVRFEMGVQEAKKQGIDKDPIVVERIREEIYKGLVEKELSKKIQAINISDKEMKNYYEKYPEIKTSHILIEVKPGATDAERAVAKKRAEEIYRDVTKSKRSFEELVKLYSDDIATKAKGGDVGYQSRISVLPVYYDAANKLKMGQISNLVETPYGFHIIKLTGRRPYNESSKTQIRAAIFEQKRTELFNQYFEKLKRHYKIKVHPELV